MVLRRCKRLMGQLLLILVFFLIIYSYALPLERATAVEIKDIHLPPYLRFQLIANVSISSEIFTPAPSFAVTSSDFSVMSLATVDEVNQGWMTLDVALRALTGKATITPVTVDVTNDYQFIITSRRNEYTVTAVYPCDYENKTDRGVRTAWEDVEKQDVSLNDLVAENGWVRSNEEADYALEYFSTWEDVGDPKVTYWSGLTDTEKADYYNYRVSNSLNETVMSWATDAMGINASEIAYLYGTSCQLELPLPYEDAKVDGLFDLPKVNVKLPSAGDAVDAVSGAVQGAAGAAGDVGGAVVDGGKGLGDAILGGGKKAKNLLFDRGNDALAGAKDLADKGIDLGNKAGDALTNINPNPLFNLLSIKNPLESLLPDGKAIGGTTLLLLLGGGVVLILFLRR